MLKERKRKKIINLHEEGKNINRIARQVKSSWQTVKKIIKQLDYHHTDCYRANLPEDFLELQARINKMRSAITTKKIGGKL